MLPERRVVVVVARLLALDSDQITLDHFRNKATVKPSESQQIEKRK